MPGLDRKALSIPPPLCVSWMIEDSDSLDPTSFLKTMSSLKAYGPLEGSVDYSKRESITLTTPQTAYLYTMGRTGNGVLQSTFNKYVWNPSILTPEPPQ